MSCLLQRSSERHHAYFKIKEPSTHHALMQIEVAFTIWLLLSLFTKKPAVRFLQKTGILN